MTINVIHIRDADFSDPSTVYVARGRPSLKASPLGNPFILNREEDRDSVVKKYRDWLSENLKEGSEQLKELRRLIVIYKETDQLSLVCYCSPKRCHGDVIKAAIESGIYHD